MIKPKKVFQKSLSEIAQYLNLEANFDLKINGISSNSAELEAGDLFVALSGAHTHGAKFIESALQAGAAAILTDAEGAEITNQKLPTLVIENPRKILGDLSSWFYGTPRNSLDIYGVTGTNGKTTIAHLLNQIWKFEGRDSGVIGTLGVEFQGTKFDTRFTTPEADQLQKMLARAKELNLRNVVMEVSSIALEMNRLTGTKFQCVAFTNLTQDHLDFHGTMENYKLAKFKLFTLDYADFAIVNIDDSAGAELFNQAQIPMESVSRKNERADWYLQSGVSSHGRIAITIRGLGGILIEAETTLIAEHNLDNLLIAVAMAAKSGVDPVSIAQIIPQLTGAPGRLEQIPNSKNILAIVDYAHTPDAVARVLKAIKSQNRKVIGVLGCGGDRDKSKRPLMGEALVEGSDISIFTSDNPRSENPESIINEMLGAIELGETRLKIVDRREAIATAVTIAEPGDCLIILGKGHEIGQEIAGVKLPFDDREELRLAIENLK